jgi:CRISPR system Cascade subunit CasE
MYLSRLVLNLRNDQVRKDISHPYEMHRTLLRAYPDDLSTQLNTPNSAPMAEFGGKAERLLYRVESDSRTGVPTVLVQSHLAPNWTQLPAGYLLEDEGRANPQVKQLQLALHNGQFLAFRLLANPTKRLSKSLAQGREKSKRVELYKLDEQLAWLNRKAEAHGFQVVSAIPNRQQKMSDAHHALTFLSVQFDGSLVITDAARLSEAVHNGIGSAKAFGCGLLSLAPAH